MGKSINLNRQQDLLAQVTGGKNIAPGALPDEKMLNTEQTQVTGSIEDVIAAEKKRLGVDADAPVRTSFEPPPVTPLNSLPADKAAELQQAISAFSKSAETPAQPATPEPEPVKNNTGALDPVTICPRCAWDMTLPTGPLPDHFDKLKFVTTLLANKPFEKEYELFDGELLVTFRSLRPREIDACYEQISYDITTGRVKFQGDIYEVVNRYRFYLQLVTLKTKAVGGLDFEFPEGFTPKTNKKAASFWEMPADLPEGCLGLNIVEDYMTSEVFMTESIHRVVAATCRDFNRLVAQLEAMVDNANFWKRTETPS